MCRLLKVSRQGFYSWRRRPTCKRKLQDAYLSELILSIHQRSRCNYGWPRIWDELRYDHGVRCGGKRVFRLIRSLRIHGTHRRRYRKTTQRALEVALAPDLMNRDFTASRPDEKYVADITYIRTWEGWLYLAVVLDVFSRYVVGWAMATTLHTQLVVDALDMAIHQRRPPRGTIAHSDQGSQFSSLSYGRRLREAGLLASMGSRGDAYDNAMAEAFFATPRVRAAPPTSFPDPRPGTDGGLRLHRRLVQHATPAFIARHAVAGEVRAAMARFKSAGGGEVQSYDRASLTCPRNRVNSTLRQPLTRWGV